MKKLIKSKNISLKTEDELKFLRKRVKELEIQVIADSLTGIYNNKHFKERLVQEIEKSKRYKKSLCLAMMDLDDFKKCNDSFGHLEGDCLIVEISRTLKKVSRCVDIVCRYAGDEFAVILPEITLEQAKTYAQKIRMEISSLQLKCSPSISIGIAQSNKTSDMKELIQNADKALYHAKNNGKNKISDSIDVF
ncbi:MAG: GGDEF domain-containing protein [Candidatus Omnitrophica bacterium]|nr:GGDEF domain-containing protein [Candidatus Omnitrophota bacterium]